MTSGDSPPWQIAVLPMIEAELLVGVLSEASDITMILDSKGVVKFAQVNAKGSPYGDLRHWIGRSLSEFLTEECVPKLERILNIHGSDGGAKRVELNHRDKLVWQYPVRYSVHCIGYDAGAVLMLGRDLRQVAETQQQLVQAQLALEQGMKSGANSTPGTGCSCRLRARRSFSCRSPMAGFAI